MGTVPHNYLQLHLPSHGKSKMGRFFCVAVAALCIIAQQHVLAGTIKDEVASNEDFSTLHTLIDTVDDAGLEGEPNFHEALAADGELTVFAPSNEAIEKSLKDLGITADQLLADPANVAKILKFHVAEGKVMAADITDGMEIDTLLGDKLKASVGDDGV